VHSLKEPWRCLCNAHTRAPSDLRGPGNPLHEQEVGYNYTAPGPIPKIGSAGLCVSARADSVVELAPCGSNPAGQGWEFTPEGDVVLTSNTSLCLSAGPAAAPAAPEQLFGSHMVLQVRPSAAVMRESCCARQP